MPSTSTEGLWAAIGATLAALLTALTRVVRPRRSRADRAAEERGRLDQAWAHLDAEKHQLLTEVRAELDECRRRSDDLEALVRTERFRTALLIRALQEAQIPVPDAALLEFDFDPATGTYRLRDVA